MFLIPLIGLIGPSKTLATEIKAPQEELALTPSLCIVSPDSGRCDIQVAVTWTTTTPICLELAEPAPKRWCITDKGQKSLVLNISTDTDLHFLMRNQLNNKQIAEAVLKITPLSEPQTRRRFRNPWSIF